MDSGLIRMRKRKKGLRKTCILSRPGGLKEKKKDWGKVTLELVNYRVRSEGTVFTIRARKEKGGFVHRGG